MQPVVHPATEKTLRRLAKTLPQSLLINGERGVGLKTIAAQLAGKELGALVQPQDAKGNTDSENGTITVEMIRNLYEQTRAKHTARHIIIIDDAERMSRGAESAFLKLLEEPNEHIYFILTSHQPQKLLPTIRSRVQQVIIQPVTPAQSADFIASLSATDHTRQAQLQFIAEGLPAELARLISDESYFKERAEIIGDARDFLQADMYKKLLIAQKYRSNRAGALQLCDSAMHILRRTLSAKPQQALVAQLEKLLETSERLASNHNILLQLTQFVL